MARPETKRPHPAGLYVQVARRTFLRFATYRSATAAGLFTNTAFAFIQVYILLAVIRSRGQVLSATQDEDGRG